MYNNIWCVYTVYNYTASTYNYYRLTILLQFDNYILIFKHSYTLLNGKLLIIFIKIISFASKFSDRVE